MRRGKPKRGGNKGNKGTTKIYFLIFAAGFVAVTFFLIGGILKSCTNDVKGIDLKRTLNAVGVKNLKDVGRTYQDLEAKYEASLQTIQSLQLKMERTKRNIPIGSVNNDAIPGIKPLQVGQKYADQGGEAAAAIEKHDEKSSNQLMPPPGEANRLPIQKAAIVGSDVAAIKKHNLRRDSKSTRNLHANNNDHNNNNNKQILGKTALVVICFNRPKYLRKTLDKIFEYYHNENDVTIFLSQDGRVSSVESVIDNFIAKFKMKFPDSPVPIHLFHTQSIGNGYMKLAQHFKYALNEIFVTRGHARTIIVEDDLEIAPDFFDYFNAMAPILDNDDTVMAISAWNDNGFQQFTTDATKVVRSDFFPGLGWMLNKRMWDEWGPKWPKGYWDDWLREPPQRKNRVTIRPEISRTFTFGKKGVSHAQFFERYLGKVVLNKEHINWKNLDFSYLNKESYDKELHDAVDKATATDVSTVKNIAYGHDNTLDHDVKIFYKSLDKGPQPSFHMLANQLGIMGDSKARVPRTGYLGIVSLRAGNGNNKRIFLVPAVDVKLK